MSRERLLVHPSPNGIAVGASSPRWVVQASEAVTGSCWKVPYRQAVQRADLARLDQDASPPLHTSSGEAEARKQHVAPSELARVSRGRAYP